VGAALTNSRGRFRLEGVTLAPGRNRIRVRQKEKQIEMNNRSIMVEAAESPEETVEVISEPPSRPDVQIDFPLKGAVTDAIFLPLRGSVDTPGATVQINGYYSNRDYASVADGRFVSGNKIPLLPGENVLYAEAILPDGSRGVDKITVYSKKDAIVPSVGITSPAKGEEVYERFVPVTGIISSSVEKVIVNEAEAAFGSGAFTAEADVGSQYVYNTEGYETMITAWAIDESGRIGHSDTYPKYRHIEPPSLSIVSPMNGETLASSPAVVAGEVHGASEVLVNGISAMIDDSTFEALVDLKEGQNNIIIIARNSVKATVRTISVTYIPGTSVALEFVTVEPSSVVVPVGETRQVKAMGFYSDEEQKDITGECSWMSSKEDIAEVSAGLVTGLSEGTAMVTATCSGITGTATVYVPPPLLETVMVAYFKEDTYYTDNPSVTIGETLQFKALGIYSDGSTSDISSRVKWQSSNTAVASIDAGGIAMAFTQGVAEITATDQNTFITGNSTLTVTPPAMNIFISSPSDGSAINKPETTVTGTITTSSGIETGVVVNGVVATVTGSQFTANHIPLTEGLNTVTATANDIAGNTASASITVNAVTTGDYIQLTSNIESGIAPLEVTLRIDGSFSIEDSSIRVSGPAQPEVLSSGSEEYEMRITEEGIYYFTASATGPDGTVYQDTIAITALNRTELDSLLKEKWEGMKRKLATGDISGAVVSFDSASQKIYRDQFTTLSPVLSDIVNELNTAQINMVSVDNRIAEYEILVIRDGTIFSIPLKLIRDDNGLWKIWAF
jgi:hypothetical protein